MLLFSTILDIKEAMTKDDFIRLVIEWNQGSPHANNIIPGIQWNGERNIRYGEDGLWLDIEEYRNQIIIAVSYEKKEDDGTIWDTDYVMKMYLLIENYNKQLNIEFYGMIFLITSLKCSKMIVFTK